MTDITIDDQIITLAGAQSSALDLLHALEYVRDYLECIKGKVHEGPRSYAADKAQHAISKVGAFHD